MKNWPIDAMSPEEFFKIESNCKNITMKSDLCGAGCYFLRIHLELRNGNFIRYNNTIKNFIKINTDVHSDTLVSYTNEGKKLKIMAEEIINQNKILNSAHKKIGELEKQICNIKKEAGIL